MIGYYNALSIWHQPLSATGVPAAETLGADRCHHRVFVAPPWPAIYTTDPDRRHGLNEAIAEYDRLAAAYPSLGYHMLILPRISVAQRADLVLETLKLPSG